MDGIFIVDMCLATSRQCYSGSVVLGRSVCVADAYEMYSLSLAVAAAEGRVLAVAFLLGVSADPNTLDRWQGSPMDDALYGGTLYHKYCGKLLQAWGGELSRYQNSDEGEEFLKELQTISMKTVRALISKLIAQGLDRMKPHRLGDQELLTVMSASVGHMDLIVRLKERAADITAEMSVLTQSIERCGMEMQSHLENTLKVLEIQARMSYVPEIPSFESTGPSKTRPSTGKHSIRQVLRKASSHDNLTALDLTANKGNVPNKDTLRQSVHWTASKPLRKTQSWETGDGVKRQSANVHILEQSESAAAGKLGQGTERSQAMQTGDSVKRLQSFPPPEWKAHGAFSASCPQYLQQVKGRRDKMEADDRHGQAMLFSLLEQR